MDVIEQIIDDPLFYRWVFYPDDYTSKIWTDFMADNPDYADQLIELKDQLLQIQFVNEKMKEKEKKQLAREILQKTIDKNFRKKKSERYINWLRYVAVAVLFFCLGGGLFYWQLHDASKLVISSEMPNLSQVSVPMLILPEGKRVDLQETESKLDYSMKGRIVLNGSTVIKPEKKETVNKINQVVIPYGNRSKITLADSTVVHLNAGSRLVYPSEFSDSKREVFLFGEAFFEVARDKKHPFVVHTSDMSIQVLGTKFNVCAYPDDNVIQTVLTEGKISLRRKDASMFEDDIVLLPDQMAWYNKKSQKVNIRRVDVSYYTLWKDGVIKFSNEDLSRVIKQLERFYNVKFRFENPLDGDIHISGKLNLKKEREEVFEYVSKVALVNIKNDEGNRYVIK